MITMRIKKQLRNFEEYANDVARGENIPSMPVYYRFEGEDGEGEIYSDPILIQTPEPDFSMPFNVNAVTHALFGILFCNTVFALYPMYGKEFDEAKVIDGVVKEAKVIDGRVVDTTDSECENDD